MNSAERYRTDPEYRERQKTRKNERYKNNPEFANRMRADARIRSVSKREERRKFLEELKMSLGCIVCGYKEHPAALDFDHRESEEKSFIISSYGRRNWEKVLLEIQKCDILCANCHRIKTTANWHNYRGGRPRIEKSP